jgi:MFS transporter, FSR family, fosmidomycin resistance protein
LQKLRPLILPLIMISIVRNFMDAIVGTYMPTLLHDGGASLIFAGSSVSVIGIAGVCGAFLSGPLSDRIGRKTVVLVSMVTSPLMMVVFLLLNGWLKMPALLLMSFAGILATPPILALVQETCPENRALVNGLYMAFSFIIYSVDVLIVGQIGDFFDLRTAAMISVAVVLIGLPFVFLLPKKVGR